MAKDLFEILYYRHELRWWLKLPTFEAYLERPEGCISAWVLHHEVVSWTHRRTIINDLIFRIGATDYLEIGCGDSRHYSSISCAHKESVDPAEGAYSRALPTHRMTSDQYFATHTKRFDLVFIDGLHHADQVERDLLNALKALKPGGVIVCHDLNPTSEQMQVVPRIQKEWTGDGWKAWVRLRRRRPDLAMVVVEADYGVGIIVPECGPSKAMEPIGESSLCWTGFVENRSEWLHLLAPIRAKDLVYKWLNARPSIYDPTSHS